MADEVGQIEIQEEAIERLPRKDYLAKLRDSISTQIEGRIEDLAQGEKDYLEAREEELQDSLDAGHDLTLHLRSFTNEYFHPSALRPEKLEKWVARFPKQDLPKFITQLDVLGGSILTPCRQLTRETQQMRYKGGEIETIDYKARREKVGNTITFSSSQIKEQYIQDRTQAHILALLLRRVLPLSLEESFKSGSDFAQLEGEARYLRSGDEGREWQKTVNEKVDQVMNQHPDFQFPTLKTHLDSLFALEDKIGR